MQAAELEFRRPAVETAVVRFIQTRLQVTHEERAICVISGPWGIGKTTALEAFADVNGGRCIIVKVEQGSTKKGASPVFVLQQTIEALRPLIGRSPRATLSNAYWSLRQILYKNLNEWNSLQAGAELSQECPKLSLVFDEAQYLSRDAIEMLRYWNDTDRTVTPFPVGLIFVGNSEFALGERVSGHSALSGAVRSRALFIETLSYKDVTDDDVTLFLRSLGAYDDEAMRIILTHFRQPRIRRDFRSMAQLDGVIRRRSAGPLATGEIVRSILG